MAVYINKDGKKEGPKKPRAYWTGAAKVNGVRMTFKLNAWKGEPGSTEFIASREQAERELAERVETLENRAAGIFTQKDKDGAAPLTFEEISEKFSEYKKPRCGMKRFKGNLERAKSFLDFLKRSGVNCLELATVEQVKAWLEFRGGSTFSKVENLGLVKLLYKKYCNPFAPVAGEVSELKEKAANYQSHKIFAPDEISNIIETAAKLSPLVKSLAVIAACTGLRFKDIALMKWEAVNFERGLIALKTHKTKAAAVIGLWPLLRSELETLPRAGEYLFPDAVKNYALFYVNALEGLRRVLVAAGYPVESMSKKVEGYKNLVSLYGWHSFRGSFVVAALRAGVSMDILKKILGAQTVDILYAHYIQVDDGFLRDAFTSKAPSFAQGNKKAP